MSQELKIGDQVQINAVDPITAEYFPNIVGSHVTVVSFSDRGNAAFSYSTPEGTNCPFTRVDEELMFIQESHGWKCEIL